MKKTEKFQFELKFIYPNCPGYRPMEFVDFQKIFKDHRIREGGIWDRVSYEYDVIDYGVAVWKRCKNIAHDMLYGYYKLDDVRAWLLDKNNPVGCRRIMFHAIRGEYKDLVTTKFESLTNIIKDLANV